MRILIVLLVFLSMVLFSITVTAQLTPAEIAKMQLQLKAADSLNKISSGLISEVSQKLKEATPIPPPVDTATYYIDDPAATYVGSWTHRSGDKPQSYENTYSFGNEANGYLTQAFDGDSLIWKASTYPTHGIAEVKIDNLPSVDVNLYSATPKIGAIVYRVKLAPGSHTVTVKVSRRKDSRSSDYWIEHDAFKIRGIKPAPPDPPIPGPVTGSYYVSPSGSDAEDGDQNSPFKTITKAASVARSGDTVVILAGVYRETAIPANSGTKEKPIVFIGTGEVIVSGLEATGDGWVVHSGNIYKKSITLPVNGFTQMITSNTTIAANQLFKNGSMIIQARWPKAENVEALFDRNKLRHRSQVSNWNNGSITDSGLPQIPGGWTGAKIFITGWYTSQTGTVTGGSGTTINYTANNNGTGFNQWYYLTGKLGALTQANEFHYENGTLYVWQPGGGPPSNIEYKKRNYGFDLSGKTGIVIKGIKFFACEIAGNTSTNDCTIDNNRFTYQNHTFLLENPTGPFDKLDNSLWVNMKQTGVRMIGNGNTIINNEFKYAASQGSLLGPNGRLENNLFEWIDYEGSYACPIAPWENADNLRILRNTFRNTGRSSIDFGWINLDTHLNIEIAYNDAFNFCMLSSDGAGIYAGRFQDLNGTRIHHNWVHNSYATHSSTSDPNQQGINAGLYYDQGTGSSTTNDHNVFWDNKQSDFHISTYWEGQSGNPPYNPHLERGKAKFFNNTLTTWTTDEWKHGYWTYLNVATKYYDDYDNNINRAHVIGGNWNEYDYNGENPMAPQACLYRRTDPLFVGGSERNPVNVPSPQTYFQLKDNSPGRNTGISIPGINDDDNGSKDIGAYAYGQTGWVAGYKAVGQ